MSGAEEEPPPTHNSVGVRSPSDPSPARQHRPKKKRRKPRTHRKTALTALTQRAILEPGVVHFLLRPLHL